MKPTLLNLKPALLLAIAAMASAGLAFADKPNDKGRGHSGDKGGKQEQRDDRSSHDGKRAEVRERDYFDDRRRTAVHDYYHGQYRDGRCPPGLAKKHNGCMPPGQARKWSVGRPLPREVIYYEVPSALIVQIGRPPSGYRYVRVASDILLITVGTAMVVDAIQDLGWL